MKSDIDVWGDKMTAIGPQAISFRNALHDLVTTMPDDTPPRTRGDARRALIELFPWISPDVWNPIHDPLAIRAAFNLDKKLRWQVMHRDDHTCQVCHRAGDEAAMTVDHILAISNGGTNDESNLRTLCGPCNSSKGDR